MCKKLICLVSFVLVLGLALTSVVEAATDLVGHWKFDEGSGNIAKDSSGNGHDGTFNGNPQWVEGQLGGALDFDGDDSVEIPHHPSLSITDEITVTAWAKIRAGAGGELAIISKGGWAANDLPFELTQVPGGPTCWQFYDDGGRDMCNPPTLPEEEWHHIAGTYDGQSFKIYYDGVLEEEEAYVGTMPENTASVTIGQRSRGGTFYDGTIDEVAIYNRALSEDEIAATMMGLSDARLASEPTPTDEATDVPRDVTLSWTPGEFAPAVNGHIVYLSENFNDVNDGIGGITQSAGSYAPPQRLDLDTTYYWRVDEVNAPPDSTVFEGDVWSFETEPVALTIANVTATASSSASEQGPASAVVDGSGLTDDLHSTVIQTMWASAFGAPQPTWIEFEFDRLYVHHEMWAWNSNTELESAIGYGFQDVTVEYSLDGVEFATLGSTHEFARAPGADGYAHNTAIDFGGVQAKYVKLTVNTNWALFPFPQFGLSEVRFLHIPVRARKPQPDPGTTDVPVDVALSWRAGRQAAEHNVYVSIDEQAVTDGTAPLTTLTEASLSPSSLELGTTYYWRIDEVNAAETPATWQGEVLSFTTQEFIAVEDFESYNDIDPPDPESNRIFESWLDGYADAANGSLVGHDPPQPSYLETTTVHSGGQSLPFFYNNTGTAAFSEAARTFAAAQDWTKYGVQTLVVWFYGNPGNTGQLYVKINGVKVAYAGDAADIARPKWTQWPIELASVGTNLQSVTSLAVGVDGLGSTGTLLFDDIRLHRAIPEPPFELWFEAEAADSITAPMEVYPNATGDPVALANGAGLPSGGSYIGTPSSVPNNGDDPGTQDIATYTFTVPVDGTYAIWGRVSNVADDSFWVHIPDGQYDVPVHASGWIRWNSIDPETADWHWVRVFSDDAPGNAVVNVTLTAGQHTILWAHRESQNYLDAFTITKVD